MTRGETKNIPASELISAVLALVGPIASVYKNIMDREFLLELEVRILRRYRTYGNAYVEQHAEDE